MAHAHSCALGLVVAVLFAALAAFSASTASAHQSGCHRWHSCPSDTGSYICGDLGYPCQYPGGSTTPPATPPPAVDYDCADFSSQQAAQNHLDADSSDPSGLDADKDDLACEDNPCPCAPEHPRADTDLDGVLNASDACPTEPGSVGGCPDTDLDGIPDASDACATTAGVAELGGCPAPSDASQQPNCKAEKKALARAKNALSKAKRNQVGKAKLSRLKKKLRKARAAYENCAIVEIPPPSFRASPQ